MKILDNLINSFTTEKGGFAARKLTAFAFMVCIAYVHYSALTIENVEVFLWVDLCGVMLCLGLVTASNIIALKNGSNNNNTDNATN
jgi:hypothetical protein